MVVPVQRVAVIGASHWHAPLYLAALAESGVHVVAVTDPDGTLAEQLAAPLAAASGADIDAVLDQTEPDLAVVLGRHDAMAASARAVAERGIPMVLEKPGALSLAELTALERQLRGCAVAVPLVHRFAPFADALRALGPLTQLSISYLVGPPDRYPAAHSPWMLDPAAGGGVLANLGPHFTDLVMQLGGSVTDVAARTSAARHGLPIEDHAVLVLTTDAGLTATIEVGYLFPAVPSKRHVNITASGPGGTVAIGPSGTVLRTGPDGTAEDQIDVDSDPLFGPFVARALDTYGTGFDGLPGLTDLVAAMRVVDAAYREAGRPGGRAWAM